VALDILDILHHAARIVAQETAMLSVPSTNPSPSTSNPGGADGATLPPNGFDLVVIGAGPGGYVAAIRAAQLGLKVACVEKDPPLGGTCLNVGCIPSKALLESSEHFHFSKKELAAHGVRAENLSLDLPTMMKRKDQVVRGLTEGIVGLFRKHGVTRVRGTGRLVGRSAAGEVPKDGGGGGGEHAITVTSESGPPQRLSARRVLIATGSIPAPLPGARFDGERIVSSTEALAFPEVPGTLVVIGAGVIGLELGSVWSRLGSRVIVLEYLERILAGMDTELAQLAQRSLARQGLEFQLGCRVQQALRSADGLTVEVTYRNSSGAEQRLTGDRVLVAIGRSPFTAGLGVEEVGLTLERGRIPVGPHYETRVPGIYAIGDVIAGPMLAHKAEEEGIAAVEHMVTGQGHVNYDAIPSIVYTWPEIASVGKTEDELKAAAVEYRAGKFPFAANGRARSMGFIEGSVKLLADRRTDRLLGAHILGPRAGDLIAELALAIEMGAAAEDVARGVHAHPTLAEVVKEAALAVDGRPIHI
jgi:dihydrolipoamide dehydrogenase